MVLGEGPLGMGVGVWVLAPNPHPQTPNPQSPIPIIIITSLKKLIKNYFIIYFNLKVKE